MTKLIIDNNNLVYSLLLIINVICVPSSATTISNDTNIFDSRIKYIQLETDLWKRIGFQDRNIDLKDIFDTHRKFVTENVQDTSHLNEINAFLVLNRFYEWKLLEQNIISLDKLFDAFLMPLNKYDTEFDELALKDLAETILHDKQFPVEQMINSIENVMIKQGLYLKIMLEAKSEVCSTRQSAQQLVYQLYTAISLTELKGYIMLQFSWLILTSYEKGNNHTLESKEMQKQFNKRIEKTLIHLRGVMMRADRTVWRCDPQEHIVGVTHEEITRLLQGYIENEVDMNVDGTCRENCAAYPFAQNHGCFKDLYCSKQPRCSGNLLDCQYYDSDMTICPSKSNSDRRYEYIEYENGRILGNKVSCSRGTTKVDSWWRWLFWHCSYCLCMCDEQGPKSDRYFNLRDVVSNIAQNKVVTGIRFKKINRIIHLQIQEGKLLPNGYVDSITSEWKPIELYSIYDRGVRNGVDYHTLTWDKRSIDLDDIIAINNHVITGVRFRMLGSHLNLEARITEIDPTAGKLLEINQSYWISNDNTESSQDAKRTQIHLKRPDISIKTKSKSLPTSTTNQFIEFTHTDVDADAAQTTIPFIDCQDVSSMIPVALTGVGIYHKGQPNYGGFIAPKLITFNVVNILTIPESVSYD